MVDLGPKCWDKSATHSTCVKLLHKHDKLTQCCRAFTLALARLSCFLKVKSVRAQKTTSDDVSLFGCHRRVRIGSFCEFMLPSTVLVRIANPVSCCVHLSQLQLQMLKSTYCWKTSFKFLKVQWLHIAGAVDKFII